MEENIKTNVILKDLIFLDNLTQAEFAKKVGVSATSVNKWIKGRNVAARHRRRIEELYPEYNILWGWKE